YNPGMLFDDDVVANRQAKARALTSWLSGEERIEHLFPDFGLNTNTIVPYPDLHAVTEAFGRGRDGRLKSITALLPLTLGCRIEAVRDQVQQDAVDLLGKSVDLPGRGVEKSRPISWAAAIAPPSADCRETSAAS